MGKTLLRADRKYLAEFIIIQSPLLWQGRTPEYSDPKFIRKLRVARGSPVVSTIDKKSRRLEAYIRSSCQQDREPPPLVRQP